MQSYMYAGKSVDSHEEVYRYLQEMEVNGEFRITVEHSKTRLTPEQEGKMLNEMVRVLDKYTSDLVPNLTRKLQ